MFSYTDKHRGIYPGDSSNDGNKICAGQDTDWKTESWDKGLRGRSSVARNHLAVWALELQFRYHRIQVHIRHL